MSALTYRVIERRFLQRKVRIAWWSAAEAPKALGTTAITAPAVDNHDATYLLQVLLSGPGVCLYGARVRYRVPTH